MAPKETPESAKEHQNASNEKNGQNVSQQPDMHHQRHAFENHEIHKRKPYYDIIRRAQARLFLDEQQDKRRLETGEGTKKKPQNLTPEQEEKRFERTIELMIKEDEANALLNAPYKLPFVNTQQKEFSVSNELFRRPGEATLMWQLTYLLALMVLIAVFSHLFRKMMIILWRFSVYEDVMWIDDMTESAGGMIITMPGYGQDVYVFHEDVEELQALMGEESYKRFSGQKFHL